MRKCESESVSGDIAVLPLVVNLPLWSILTTRGTRICISLGARAVGKQSHRRHICLRDVQKVGRRRRRRSPSTFVQIPPLFDHKGTHSCSGGAAEAGRGQGARYHAERGHWRDGNGLGDGARGWLFFACSSIFFFERREKKNESALGETSLSLFPRRSPASTSEEKKKLPSQHLSSPISSPVPSFSFPGVHEF